MQREGAVEEEEQGVQCGGAESGSGAGAGAGGWGAEAPAGCLE